MEDRLTGTSPGRPGVSVLALFGIIVITAGWWALALWPAGAVEPEWLSRTRAACFGSTPGGLPDLGGWILLIGQPLGMVGVLIAVWGDALRRDFASIWRSPSWRVAGVGVAAITVIGLVALGQRLAWASGVGVDEPPPPAGNLMVTDIAPPPFRLVDQQGRSGSLAELVRGPAILTFAFGHCGTICPTVVHEVIRAREASNRTDLPLIVLTLDPWRDTPGRLPGLATQWGLGPGDLVLSGRIEDVQRTLDALRVGRRRDDTTGDIDHVAAVMVLDARGHVARRLDGGWGIATQLVADVPASQTRIEPTSR